MTLSLKQRLSAIESSVTSNLGGTDSANTSEAVSASTRASSADSKAVSVGTRGLTMNLNKKNVGSVQNSSADARLSTTGDFAINGVIYTKTASSAVFTLAGTTLTSSQACMFLLALDSAGSGQVTQGNIASTSAGCSLPATPANQCPVGQLTIASGASTFVPGTTTFSQNASATGSAVFADLMTRS